MDEKWFQICGYEGLYEWSPQLEVVRSVARKCTKGGVLKWQYDSYGRPYVHLCKNGKVRNFYKAMFVYSHTHQCEIPIEMDVHHIDGCKDNNSPNNLLMLSHEEHARLHAKTRECCQKNNTINSKAVVAIDEKGNVVHRFTSTQEAGRNGFGQRNVSCACRGIYRCKSNPHYYNGYYWYFEQEWLANR